MATVNKFTDRKYLKDEQYRNSGNLRSRVSLHDRYSTNPIPWHTWVFDQIILPPTAVILEAGCGPGLLWSENLNRLPPGWQVALSDLSQGMVEEAHRSLQPRPNFSPIVLDVMDAPFKAACFDAIIANHMLYHLPDVDRALATIHRLLKPGGILYAATNGRTHLQEMAGFVNQALGDSDLEAGNMLQRSARNFTLQSGRAQLSAHFASVELCVYPDSLAVDDPEAIVHYVESSSQVALPPAGLSRLRAMLQEELETHGTITISKESGLFIATKSGSF